ncbi:Serine/threonine protein kinase [Actinacidiphila yanglinensis]|uniref:non-specific serine/threonine protein kinase n=1 Tax=Actinacidiphila yanglinensis TaxID=310779 RepID=A0A1H6E3X2_9ACTN|nr:Serine/threonine protein kinase [Actinacidiphila yanglinensis]
MAGEAQPGQLVGGRYRLVRRLGAGGFGRVWQAHDEALRVEVAVKEVWLPPAMNGAERAERVVRAERESRNAARLRNHPNIVTVHDVVVENGVPWTVMQLVTGTSLADHETAHGPLPVEDVAKVAAALLSALGAAHEAGIVHRDVKPDNVMLADDGQVLLTDFGIALHQADTALTVAGGFIGSIEYVAPERARGADGQGVSDLFSLGVTLYQMLEGISPFRRDTPTATLAAILLDEPPAPRRSAELAPLIIRLMTKDPNRRPTVVAAKAMLDGMSLGGGPTAVATAPDLAVAAPEPAGTMARDSAVPPDPGVAPAPEAGDGPHHEPGRPKRGRTAAIAGGAVAVVAAIVVPLVLWSPGHHAAELPSGLRDPCAAVPQTDLNQLGFLSVIPTHHTDDVHGHSRWCEWDANPGTLLSVGYDTESMAKARAGDPGSVPFGRIKGAYEVWRANRSMCVLTWPTSFGTADMTYQNSPQSDCSTTEALALMAYPNLSH